MNTLSAFYWGLLRSSAVLILVPSCMSCRAGKWPYWSLWFGEENFTFLTKQNWAIASLSTPLHVVLQRKVSRQQGCAGEEQGCGNHSTLWLQVAAILMPLSIPVTVSKGDQDVVGSPLAADQSSQSKGGECQELGDQWESLDGGSSCPAQTARTSQHVCPLSPTCVLVGLVRPRVTEGRSGDKDSFLADVWPAEHCFLPWSWTLLL